MNRISNRSWYWFLSAQVLFGRKMSIKYVDYQIVDNRKRMEGGGDWINLPKDIRNYILFKFLEWRDIANLAKLNSRWKQFVSSDEMYGSVFLHWYIVLFKVLTKTLWLKLKFLNYISQMEAIIPFKIWGSIREGYRYKKAFLEELLQRKTHWKYRSEPHWLFWTIKISHSQSSRNKTDFAYYNGRNRLWRQGLYCIYPLLFLNILQKTTILYTLKAHDEPTNYRNIGDQRFHKVPILTTSVS